jgi:hypothetical protein
MYIALGTIREEHEEGIFRNDYLSTYAMISDNLQILRLRVQHSTLHSASVPRMSRHHGIANMIPYYISRSWAVDAPPAESE